MSEPTDGVTERVMHWILNAFGDASEGEFNSRIEAAFPGFLAAHAEWEAAKAAFGAKLQVRLEDACQFVNARLPDGPELIPQWQEQARTRDCRAGG